MPPLSYSSISNFLQCPHKFEQVNLLKNVRDDGSAATRHGNLVHTQIENYILRKSDLVPIQAPADHLLDLLRSVPGVEVEKPLAVRKGWEPCGFDDKDAVLRGRMDVVAVMAQSVWVIDWKTGKRRDNSLQAKVYIAMAAPLYPGLPIRATFDYLEKGRDNPIVVPPKEAQNHVGDILKAIWETRKFIPRPSGLCGWCPVNTCQYWRER